MTFTFRFARALARMISKLVTHVDSYHIDRIPKTGPFILVSNHLGRLDAMLTFNYTDRSDVTILVAEKYKQNPVFRWFVPRLNAIWVDRFNADLGAMRTSLSRLKAGGGLVMAPEGTRSPTGALIEGRPGSGYLAAKAQVPIVPVAVTGS